MYLWKCWHDTRMRLIVLLPIITTTTVLTVVFFWNALHNQSIWSLPVRGGDPFLVSRAWKESTVNAVAILWTLLLAWIFGVSAVGEEFSGNTVEYVFTRPLSRRNLIWSSWGLGAGQLAAAVAACILAAFATRAYLTQVAWWHSLILAMAFLFLGMIVQGVFFLLTTLFRGKRIGSSLAVWIVVLYPAMVGYLSAQYKINLPTPAGVMEAISRFANFKPVNFPTLSFIGWTVFIVSCPLVAQWYVERTEV